ncbi:MAG: response regulator transcription factor [Anaerolineales bacterium]|nr:response regulator transcription factor [Anaerolineales bacterium]
MNLKLLLVDDHALFRQSLNVLLAANGYEVIGMAGNGYEALEAARRLRPDLILMDIEMPGCDGLTATRLIKAEMPDVTIVMLTVSAADEHLFAAIKSGAGGYLLKSQSADQFLQMVAQVAAGGAALPPDLAARLLREFARQSGPDHAPADEPAAALTPRQLEILTLLAQGQTYPQIGGILHLSEVTIRYHVKQMMERLHLENRAQVIAYAARHGLTPPPDG